MGKDIITLQRTALLGTLLLASCASPIHSNYKGDRHREPQLNAATGTPGVQVTHSKPRDTPKNPGTFPSGHPPKM